MAFLAADDKQLQNGQQPGQDQGSGMSSVIGGSEPGATVGGQPVSTAGVGAGGAGGWTNIQAYLGANQGNKQDSANKLTNTVGSQFNQEKTQLNSKADETETKAKAEVTNKAVGQDQASQMIEKMGSNYQYPTAQASNTNPLAQPTAPNEYAQNKTKLQGALNAQYAGPDSFAYGLGAKTQEYGGSLGQDDTFKNLMGDLYNDAAGGYLGKGGKLLQNQLDNGNEYLASARSNLLNDYSGLSSAVDGRVAGANKVIADSRSGVDANKTELKKYLTGQSQQNLGAIDSAIANYKTADQVNAKATGNIYWNNDALQNYQNTGMPVQTVNRSDYGQWNQGVVSDGVGKLVGDVGNMRNLAALNSQLDPSLTNSANLAASNDAFYDPSFSTFQQSNANRESKGIADGERSKYNSILDALGMNEAAIGQKADLSKGKYEVTDANSYKKLMGWM